jgi:predicted porin
VSIDNGGDLSTRVGQVGLEGAFGRVWAGSGWAESYGMTYGSTDVANTGSGSIVYGKHNGMRQGRLSNMIQYRTPDISGFQGALGINVKSGADNDPASESEAPERVGITDGVVNGNPARVPHVLAKRAADKDDNDVEMWTIAAKYGVQGFTGAFAYSVKPDSYAVGVFSKSLNDRYTSQIENTAKEDANGNYVDLMQTKDDYSAWTAKLGYSQDNWYVNGWYGKNNDSDFRYTYTANKKLNDAGDAYVDATEYARSHSPEDSKFVSIAGGVSVDKVNMYAVWEQFDYGNGEDATTVIGVQYNLGSRSRVWMDFINQDLDSNSKAEDHVMVGLRHDF